MSRAIATLALLLIACATSPGPTNTPLQGDCRAAETQQACGELRGCRYLTPGCAEGDETPLPEAAAGCYPIATCTDATCAAGTTCRVVIVNPCLPTADGVTCDACGEQLAVCLGD